MSGPSRKQSAAAARRRNLRHRNTLAQRTETVRRHTASDAPQPAHPHRRRNTTIGVAIAAILLIGIVVYVRSTGSSAPAPELVAAVVTPQPTDLFVFDDVDAYTATYRVDSYDGTNATTTTQTATVLRPFEARVVGRSGAPPGGDEQWAVTTSLGLYEQSTAADGASTEVAAPATGLGDYRLDASVGDLVADGTYEMRDRRTLLGRECQVYRTGSPVESYAITAPTNSTYVDLCLDHTGIVLEELVVVSGQVTQHLVATAVDVAPALTDGEFAVANPPAGNDSLTEISPDTPPISGCWSFATVPDGYTLQQRYRLSQTVADPTTATADMSTAATIIVDNFVDVYTSGIDTIVVHQGPTAVEPTVDTSGTDASVGDLGTVHIASGVRGVVTSAHPAVPADWFVHVTATMPRADLRADLETMKSS